MFKAVIIDTSILVNLVKSDTKSFHIFNMPAKSTKKATTNTAAATPAAEVKPVGGDQAPATVPAGDVKSDSVDKHVSEKKPRPPPKVVTGSSVSETRVRKALSNSMSPEISHAVSELKLLSDMPKKFGDLSDATVLLVLQHKPESPSEEELKKQTEEQKKQLELRNTLHTLFQAPRASWADRLLSKEDAKVLRRMVKQDTIRTGDDAIVTFTATANFVVRELAQVGLKNVRAEEKRVMKLHHVVEDIATLSSWPLLKELKCVSGARVDHVKRLQEAAQKAQDKKEKQKKKKAEKAAAATTGGETKAPESSASPAAAPQAAESTSAGSEEKSQVKRVKTPEADFEHHSQNIVREVCQENNMTCEISGEVKHFCSRVVYELVCLYGELIQSQTNYARVKTIKADTISSITTFILKYTHSDAPKLLKYVDEWVLKLAADEKKAKDEKAKKVSENAANPTSDASAPDTNVNAAESTPVVPAAAS